MKTRPLGNSGLHVGPLALGGNVFGWTADEATSIHVLDAFVAGGFNLVDTADVYSAWAPGNNGGESETIIGKWLKKTGTRDKIVIATKVGLEVVPGEKGLSRSYILKAAERSLNRLQVDTIDLYQAHQDDEATPLEETLGAFGELIGQGKVRAIGASNYSADRLAPALRLSREPGVPRYECLQPGYNLYDRAGYEAALEPLCVREGLGVIPYYSLAAGFLTGKYRSAADLAKSPRGAKAKGYLNDRGLRILAALDRVAARYKSTPGKVAIAWVLARPSISAPIASATNVEQLNDLLDATKLQLEPEAVQELNEASR
ncbi:MAG: putative oxidoreductase, aryl-alcohol dehydrogenase like protein [Gemmataceae bacterium]|nr:putative oxidoreductase, aryl-alcohol dehydrogenase like protein [Gemmataceae bacterium]